MEFIPQLITLTGVILVACISPGPDFIAVTSQSLSSRASGLCMAIGITIGCLFWAVLAIFGLGVILTRLSWLYEAIRYFGAAYLMYLGAKMLLSLRHRGTPLTIAKASQTSLLQAMRRGLLVNLTNPKAAAFFGSLFVAIIPAHAPIWVYAATLGIVTFVTCGWFCILAFLFSTGHVRDVYMKLHRPFDAVMGSILIGIGAKLAIDR